MARPPVMKPTVRSIAKEAGISPVTVSRALREGDPRVADETRARVLEVARKLGYRPDPEVTRLMTYLRNARDVRYQSTLALFILSKEEERPHTWGPYARQLHSGIVDRAAQLGYGSEIFNVRARGMTPRRLSGILEARNVKGVIVLPSRQTRLHLNFPWHKFSSVAATYSLWSPRLHRVVPHQYQAIQEALHQVRKLGYKRVGLALPAGMLGRTNYTSSAFFYAHQALLTKAEHRIPPIFGEEKNQGRELEHFKKWFERHRPDVVLTTECWYPYFITEFMKLRVPEDVGIAYLSQSEAPPGSAGIDQGGRRIGEAAVNYLADMINRGERGLPEWPAVLLVEGKWVAGRSLRAKRSETPAGKPAKKAAK